jgi:hypothetical protein
MHFSGSSTGAQGTILTVPTSSALDIKTGDFTIEMWIYTTSIQNYSRIFMINSTYTTGSVGLLYDTGTGKINFFTYDTGVGLLSLAAPAFNMWHHVAVTRSGSTFTLFLNGVLQATATNASAMYSTSTPYYTIGNGDASVGGYSPFTGYIDDLRITKGLARYTTNFTPPTQALPSHEILDRSVYRFPVTTYGNARIDTATKKYGTGAMYFDGTGDYLSIPVSSNTAINGTENFTVEAWLYPMVATSYHCFYSIGNWAVQLYVTSGGQISIYFSSSATGSSYIVAHSSTGTLTLNRWTHVVVQRAGNNFTIFLNGVLDSTYVSAGSIALDTTSQVGGIGGTYLFTGYIDDLRITKGYARYTANFTPPTASLPTIPPTIAADPWWGNVSLLLDGNTTDAYDPYWQNVSLMLTGDDFIDWSNQHNAVTNNGTATLSTATKKFNASSYYLSGGAQCISLTASSNLTFDTNNFTFEMWYRPETKTGTNAPCLWSNHIVNGGWGASGYVLCDRHPFYTTKFTFWVYNINSSSPILTSTTVVNNGSWYHIAITRSGSTFSLYINGFLENTLTSSTSLDGNAQRTIYIAGDTNSADSINGNVADLRITKGIARYTANFTPPIAALPAFKIQDRTQNALTLTPYGNVQLSTDVKKNGTGSMFFDGNGDYLTLTTSSNFSFGTGDFTIEMWVNPSSVAATIRGLFAVSGGAGASIPKFVVHLNSGTPSIHYNGLTNGSNIYTTSTSAISANIWTHLAFVRTNNTWTWYINGIASGTGSNSTDITFTSQPTYAGYGGESYFDGFNGYIDDLRITKGYARYTQNFTPPSQSFANQYISTGFDPNYADVSLLLTGEGTNGSTTFTDLSSSPKTITAYGDVKISTAVKKYGTGAMAFDGTGDVIGLPANSAFLLNGDYTIELWVYPSTQVQSYPCIFANSDYGVAENMMLYFSHSSNANKYSFYIGSSVFILTGTIAPGFNAWNHVAIVKSGTKISLYVNGVLDVSGTYSSTLYTSNPTFFIGNESSTRTITWFTGYIDDFRITKGIARYTANFTPPTYALATTTGTPIDINRADTSLLLRGNGTNGSTSFTDESPNNLTVTNNGSVTVNTSVKKYGTGSMYFDGTNYLSLASNAALNLSGVSWTVELWCYPTTASLANRILFTKRVPNSGTCSYQGYLNVSNSGISFFNGTEYQSSTTLDLNAWNHIAYVCDRTNVKVYKNGVLILTASATEAANNTEPLLIGNGLYTGYSLQFPGYIDDFRITKGYARYTANFTPPTYEDPIVTGTQYDYNYAQVSLLLNGDGTNGSTTFTDLSSSPKTITNIGSVTVNTTTKKFGTGSIAFSGSNYLTVPCNPIFDFGTGDFTLESWVYVAPSATLQGLFDTRSGQTYTNYIWHFETGPKLCFWLSGTYCTTTNNIPTNQWVHIATVRASGTIKHYVNGVVDNNTGFSQPGTINSTNTTALIGRLWDTSAYYLNGYIDDFRITKGLARYTTNFTPPTAPFPTSYS